MLIREILEAVHPLGLDEGVSIRSLSHLAAYAVTVAEAYDALPRFDQSVAPLWQGFAQQNTNVMLRKIANSGIKLEYLPVDPYEKLTNDPRMMVRYLLWDMVVNHYLPIYSGHSDDHPVFTPEQNVVFRTVHDYFAHGKLRATFKQQIEKMGLTKQRPSPEQLARILPTIRLNQDGNIGHTFSLRGEINAYLSHCKLVPPKWVPVLFTEVVGQACYQNVVGDFPQQKVAILHGFDYHRVGIGESDSHPVQKRIDQLMAEFDQGGTVATRIGAKPKLSAAAFLQHLQH